jgi:hypothetical protein
LLHHQVADHFFAQVVWFAQAKHWVSDQHFSVDGTLIESWASLKSVKAKEETGDDDRGDGNGWSDFRGEQRSNETHESTTDPEAKLARKGDGREAKLCFAGHAVMENRNGLCVLFTVKPTVGAPEAAVAVEQVKELNARDIPVATFGADKGYCLRPFVEGLRQQGVVPHPAVSVYRRTHGIRVGSKAYGVSQRKRRWIETLFGWGKTIGGLRRSRYLGVERTHAASQYITIMSTANLLRMARLLTDPPVAARA